MSNANFNCYRTLLYSTSSTILLLQLPTTYSYICLFLGLVVGVRIDVVMDRPLGTSSGRCHAIACPCVGSRSKGTHRGPWWRSAQHQQQHGSVDEVTYKDICCCCIQIRVLESIYICIMYVCMSIIYSIHFYGQALPVSELPWHYFIDQSFYQSREHKIPFLYRTLPVFCASDDNYVDKMNIEPHPAPIMNHRYSSGIFIS